MASVDKKEDLFKVTKEETLKPPLKSGVRFQLDENNHIFREVRYGRVKLTEKEKALMWWNLRDVRRDAKKNAIKIYQACFHQRRVLVLGLLHVCQFFR
jgi:hypothetical protein